MTCLLVMTCPDEETANPEPDAAVTSLSGFSVTVAFFSGTVGVGDLETGLQRTIKYFEASLG